MNLPPTHRLDRPALRAAMLSFVFRRLHFASPGSVSWSLTVVIIRIPFRICVWTWIVRAVTFLFARHAFSSRDARQEVVSVHA